MNNSSHTTLSWRERFFRSPLPLMLGDIFAVFSAYYTTLLIRFFWPQGKMVFTWINVTLGFRDSGEVGAFLEYFYFLNAPRILLFLTTTLIFLYAYSNLYAGRSLIRRRSEGWAVTVANVAALGLFYAYFYLTRNEFHPRSVFATLLTLNVITTLLVRKVMRGTLRSSRLSSSRVLLIGDGPEADYIERFITATRTAGLSIIARVPAIHPLIPETSLAAIRGAAETHQTQLILCADKHLSVGEIMQLLELGESLRQEVKVLSDKLNVLINEAGMPSDYFMDLPLVHFAVAPTGTFRARTRQAFFRILAGMLLLLSIPLMLLIALLIKLTSPGPVFFMQERIGINRRPFEMFKFRTMHDRAEELQAQIEEFNDSGEGLFKMRKDPRVTAIGQFLRRFSLDELPQLINVVRGEMTLVGPRPLPRRDYQNYYEEWHYSRHSGLPGLTCLWQVSGRSDISFHNMCILDDYYLRNQSMMLDLKILLRTIRVVLFAKGAY